MLYGGTYYYQAQYGYTALLTEQYETARDAYIKAVEKDSIEPTYYINLALAYANLSSTENATKAYHRAIKEYHPEAIGMVHFRLATLLYSDKKYRRVAVECRRAIDLDPKNGEAYFYLALASDRLNDVKNAVRNYKLYLERANSDSLHADADQLKPARERMNFLNKIKKD